MGLSFVRFQDSKIFGDGRNFGVRGRTMRRFQIEYAAPVDFWLNALKLGRFSTWKSHFHIALSILQALPLWPWQPSCLHWISAFQKVEHFGAIGSQNTAPWFTFVNQLR